MKYLIFVDALDAEARSRAAWSARIGTAVDPASGTVRLWGVIEHPSNGQGALQIADDDPHTGLLTNAELGNLIAILSDDWWDDISSGAVI